MKKLDEILTFMTCQQLQGGRDKQVTGISFDSRTVKKGEMFVAVRGTGTDGHLFIDQAIKGGASVIVCEEIPMIKTGDLSWVKVEDSSLALAQAASAYYDHPSGKLNLVGVTGTNGKTTIATLLYNLFTSLGYRAGLISTVGNRVAEKMYPATHTTPDPVTLNRLLSEMVSQGCDYAFMEVSSIALDQNRTGSIRFTGSIFTNLTHDHLDYHGDFDTYLSAKKKFFDGLDDGAFALINKDDRHGNVMVQNSKADIYNYSVKADADYRCRIVEERFEGMLLSIDNTEVSTWFIGDYNASNLLAVYSAARLLGSGREEVLTAMSGLSPVEGRLEVIRSDKGITGVVDYAHTPDALENVLKAINRIRAEGTQLITVVGAGGDRDTTKRSLMGRIAAINSSRLILTSDNPRSEDPDKIIDDMYSGIAPGKRDNVLRIVDRREAIKTAVMMAGRNDIILVAGKGHETYQERNGIKTHFDDREELRKFFEVLM